MPKAGIHVYTLPKHGQALFGRETDLGCVSVPHNIRQGPMAPRSSPHTRDQDVGLMTKNVPTMRGVERLTTPCGYCTDKSASFIGVCAFHRNKSSLSGRVRYKLCKRRLTRDRTSGVPGDSCPRVLMWAI